MFTGIVQMTAQVQHIVLENELMKLTIVGEQPLIEHLQRGASIAINGTCLTVVAFNFALNKAVVEFDVINETLRLTNLGNLKLGDTVNIERSLKVGDELGGHLVSGHVHGIARLLTKTQDEQNCQMQFSLPQGLESYILEKGFIGVNGISLTVGKVDDQGFFVHLIPETLNRTNLALLNLGDGVNIECDQQTITVVKTIKRLGLGNR